MSRVKTDYVSDLVEATLLKPSNKEKILKEVNNFVEKELDVEDIIEDFKGSARKSFKTMTLQLLGFRDDFHRLEIDTRRESSEIATKLREKARAATDDFLNACAEELPKITITSTIVKKSIEYYEDMVDDYLRDALKLKAERDVAEFLEESFQKAVSFHNTPKAEAAIALDKALESIKDEKLRSKVEALSAQLLEAEAEDL